MQGSSVPWPDRKQRERPERGFASSPPTWTGSDRPFESALTHIQEQRQAERYADGQRRRDGDPQVPQTHPAALDGHEHPEDDRGDDDVQTEEGTDPVREELLAKSPDIETVLAEERDELGVRKGHPRNT